MLNLDSRKPVSEFSENGKEGIVYAVLVPMREWQVKVYGGVYWRARSLVNADFEPGERIKVTGIHDMKLLIARI